jgi:membrane protease YdiL (CAAX protease family)
MARSGLSLPPLLHAQTSAQTSQSRRGHGISRFPIENMASHSILRPRRRMSEQPAWRQIFGWLPRAWAAIDAEAAADRQRDPRAAGDAARARQLLVVAAVLLALGYSFGDRPFFDRAILPRLGNASLRERYGELLSYSYWAWAKLLGYGLLPLLHLKLLGERASEYGLRAAAKSSPSGVLPWRRTYLALFALILPAVALVSTTRGFQDTYPFYRQTGRSLFDFAAWEVQYLSTFVAVEFFFRGYLLFGLRRHLGSLAIFVSMVPYCLIHVLKPPSEALGSIVAGLLLGTLALRTGSVWCGVLLHISVALSMDLLSAWQGHRLPL